MVQGCSTPKGIIQIERESQPNVHHEANYQNRKEPQSFHMLVKFTEMAQNAPIQLT